MPLSNLENTFATTFHTVAQAPGGVARLRELILTLAVQGKLVAQDASDEPASALLKKIRAEKDRLMAEGKIKKDKPLAEVTEEEKLFELISLTISLKIKSRSILFFNFYYNFVEYIYKLKFLELFYTFYFLYKIKTDSHIRILCHRLIKWINYR